MDVTRAQQILQTSEIIDVKHAGMSVWIDEVDERSKTARVHTEDDPDNRKTVPVDELTEAH